MARFVGKTAVVTGAASGMGKEVAEQLAAEGARVMALDLVFPEQSSSNTSPSPSILQRKHDVTKPEDWDGLVAYLAHGGVDILVNAAGVMDYALLHETEFSSWRHTLDVDLDGVMLGMRAVIPLMKSRGGGSIVNFSSALATIAFAGSPGYHAAKAAVMHLTRNAAVTYAADKIRVNAVLPGIIDTPMVRKQPDEYNAAAVARTPLGRMGTAREIAKCVLFIASEDAAYMTGSAVTIDGGLSAM
ncbi:2,5-dichloro-2,5-cyclohexadiene-1,4-diol dehydrogenase [Xylaria bambusicola]|uniref:2,5-dichloro-2,5-cyclohexadiene-1,4-diol dehydrogenase n=1 Tax=Xylaria bambusicola TaxID=326684 RepID=UPI00200733F8|nr:2,5-dichloro-2,5-cyclohexadiene-1,4-diol dehydrogenase [Xylaria bambusicola]KAI0503009.1 2,5-dichloro-2,5-cyclohexadiene-1,4-diol dehydrogenase [Xylaria bambusicola]